MPCARVALTTGNRTVTGTILTVEERTSQIDANKPPPVATRRVLLASDTGDFASFDFSGVQGLRLLDDGARQGVSEFANVTALARRRNARTIVVTSEGMGPRELVVSYTVPTPIWKTAYRVVLDDSLSRPHAWLLALVSHSDWIFGDRQGQKENKRWKEKEKRGPPSCCNLLIPFG